MPKGIKGFQLGHKISHNHTGNKNPMYGRHHDKKSKEKNSKSQKELYANGYINPMTGKKRVDLTLLNKSRIGIPIREEIKQKQRETIAKYWNSKEGSLQKDRLSKINKEWAANNHYKKIEAGKLGQQSCSRISSQEKKLQQILNALNVKFYPQKEYELGFIDIFIEPDIAIFVDGQYWHNFPYGTNKDKIQTNFLINNKFKVLRFWEKDINMMSIADFKNKLETIN